MSNKVEVKFAANTADLKRGTASVKREIEDVGRRAKRTQDMIAGIGKSLMAFAAGAISVQAVAGALTNAANSMDRIGKLAQQTGLGARFLQNLSLNAELSGASLDMAAKAVAKLNKELEFGSATGPTSEALRLINLEIATLKTMSPEDRLQAIATGIAGIADPAQKSAVAVQLFGKTGQELIPLLDQMADGMEKVDGLSRAQIKEIENLNDAWTRLGNSIAIASAKVLEFFTGTRDSDFRTKLTDRMVEAGIDEGQADRIAADFKARERSETEKRVGGREKIPGKNRADSRDDRFFEEELSRAIELARAEKEAQQASVTASEQAAEAEGAQSRDQANRVTKMKAAKEREERVAKQTAAREKEQEDRAKRILKLEEDTAKIKRDAYFETLNGEQKLGMLVGERAKLEREIAATKDAERKAELEAELASKDAAIEGQQRANSSEASRAGSGGGAGSTADTPLEGFEFREAQRQQERDRRKQRLAERRFGGETESARKQREEANMRMFPSVSSVDAMSDKLKEREEKLKDVSKTPEERRAEIQASAEKASSNQKRKENADRDAANDKIGQNVQKIADAVEKIEPKLPTPALKQ